MAIKNDKEAIDQGNGFMREDKSDKINYDLIPEWFITQLATHYTLGAKKHGDRNWENAGLEQMKTFRESAYRHFMQFMRGDDDEDHLSATIFNMIGIEYIRNKINDGIGFDGLIYTKNMSMEDFKKEYGEDKKYTDISETH